MNFLVASWNPDDPEHSARAREIHMRIKAHWSVLIDRPGFFAAVDRRGSAHWATALLDADRGLVIGQLFDRSSTDSGRVLPATAEAWSGKSPSEIGHSLVNRAWGAYVAILRDDDGSNTITVIRDPLGALDCITWDVGGVRFVASRLTPQIVEETQPTLSFDWSKIHEFVSAPVSVSEGLGFTHINAIPPGTACTISGQTMCEEILWRPADFCPPRVPASDADPDHLTAVIDSCVEAWSSCYGRAVAELSGGLDSAIVAAALRTTPHSPVEHWFNYFSLDPQGDERSYARSVSERLCLPLSEILREGPSLCMSDFNALSRNARPDMNGMDVHYDRDLALRAAAMGAEAIFTGQGGDAVFFQMPTALVAGDTSCSPAEMVRRMTAVARWTRSTVWSVASQNLASRWRAMKSPQPAPSYLSQRSVPRLPRWLDDTADLSPAKRLQIWGLANSRAYFGDCQRSRAADLVHPLLSQPLVEYVLSIPIIALTDGARDRKLARQAYSQRLPPAVAWRHGKGDLTSFYGRMIAHSAGFLREHLCEGMLAAQGIIDRSKIAALLNPERLAHEDSYTEILTTALVESWLQHWRTSSE